MILPELVQRLGCASCNVNIIAIALVFVKSQYYLPNSNNLLVNI